MAQKTNTEYIEDFKERARTAFGEYEGAVASGEDATDAKHAVNAILAEPTPGNLAEDPDSEPEKEPEQEQQQQQEQQ